MTTLEMLKAGRELLSDPDRWAKGSYAYNRRPAEGETWDELDAKTDIGSPDAVCWCSVGALHHVNEGVSFGATLPAEEFLNLATKRVSGDNMTGIVTYNDDPERTHEEILAVWDLAIEMAEAA